MGVSIAFISFLCIAGCLADLSNLVHIEYDGGDVLKPKPPLLASREGRFIRFDAGESEIELEMGVSVPFLKIPIPGKGEFGHPADHLVSLNPAGLLVGATLILTSFLLVPWMFPAHGHRKHGDLSGGRSDGAESSENEIPGGTSAILGEVGDFLTNMNLDPTSCRQKAICLMGTQVSAKFPGLLTLLPRIDALPKFIETSGILRTIETGSCEEAYPSCSFLTTEVFSYVPWLLKLFQNN